MDQPPSFRLTSHLLRRVCCLIAALVPYCPNHAAIADTLPNMVAAGDVTPTSVVLWARSNFAGPMLFEIGRDQEPVGPVASVHVADPWIPAKVEIDDLEPGTGYHYRVTDVVGHTAEGRFRTPAVGVHVGLRFGVSGDIRGDLRPYPSIANVPDRNLDLFVILGDSIYADVASPALGERNASSLDDFRRKHDEVLSERFGFNTWAAARASTALLAVIDDHEVRNDFAGAAPVGSDARFDDRGAILNETVLFEYGLRSFHEYNPMRAEAYEDNGDPRTAGKPKLYRHRVYGLDAAFFLLDARSFRDEPLPEIIGVPLPTETAEFLRGSFDPGRTMLGEAQLEDLKADLLAAQDANIVWKFVLVPEPIQNLGPILASDRFEGYAAERNALLAFAESEEITNLVFVAADVHGTLVNNITTRDGPNDAHRPTGAFEITTGPVAYDPPFGPNVLAFADPTELGPAILLLQFVYQVAGHHLRDDLVAFVSNVVLDRFDLDRLGLEGAPIAARLLRGRYLSIDSYGWTEFDIDAQSQVLTVTTYGIPWYSVGQLLASPQQVARRRPQIASQFVVSPVGTQTGGTHVPVPPAPPRGALCGAIGFANLLLVVAVCLASGRLGRQGP